MSGINKMRSISQILAMLIVIAISVGAGIFVAWMLFGVVGLFKQSTTVNIVGGEAYINPANSSDIFGEVIVSIVGPDPVTFYSISITHAGIDYRCLCLNCGKVISDSFPNSANDIVSLKFECDDISQASIGDRIIVRVGYAIGSELRFAVGSINIVE